MPELKPNLGPFALMRTRAREVARARRWVTRAERELAAARQAAGASAAQPGQNAAAAVPGRGRQGSAARNHVMTSRPPGVTAPTRTAV